MSHNFFVADRGAKAIKAFHADGEPAIFTAGPGQGTDELHVAGATGVSVDSAGDIYASENTEIVEGFVRVFAADGEELTSFETSTPESLAVDSLGDLYIDH